MWVQNHESGTNNLWTFGVRCGGWDSSRHVLASWTLSLAILVQLEFGYISSAGVGLLVCGILWWHGVYDQPQGVGGLTRKWSHQHEYGMNWWSL